ELFRTAHSIKGSARMMGFQKIEGVSHKIEDIFGLVRRAEIKVSPENFDVIYEGVDIISQIIELISNEGSDDSIDISVIVKKLEAIYNPQEAPASVAESKEESKPDVEPVLDVVSKAEPVPVTEAKTPEPEETEFKPTTDLSKSEVSVDKTDAAKGNVSEDAFIRVPTRRLDDLMNQVSELVTTRIKSQQRLADIRKMLDFTEEWAQQTERIRLLLDRTLSRIVNEDVERPSDVKSELITSYDLRTVVTSYLSSIEKIGSIAESISILYDKQSEENLRMSVITGDIQDNLRIIRLLPISTIFDLYPRMIRDIAKLQSKKVKFEVFGGDTRVDKKVLEELKDPLIHLLRNSIDHGIEAPADREATGKAQEGTIQVRAGYVGNMVQIEVQDDGRGIDTDRILQIAIKKGYIKEHQASEVSKNDLVGLIFHSGFSTAKIITDLSGRGVGLDIVKSNIEKIKGTIETVSEKGKGTRFTIKIPLTLATTHVLIVDVGGDHYSLPIDFIDRTVRLTEEELWTGGQNPFVLVDNTPVPLYKMEEVLGNAKQRLKNKGLLKSSAAPKIGQHLTKIETNKFPAVIFVSGGRRVAFLVDKLLDEQEVVVKSLGHQLKRVKNVAGSTVLGDGRISIILDPNDLIKSVQGSGTKFAFRDRRQRDLIKKRVLVVDDSITTRTLEKNILESAGYHVTIATNGLEGYQKLHEIGNFDIVVSDVEMPFMTGFEFAHKVRTESKFPDIPFVLCTSLESDKDKRRGIEVGANAYIVKGGFDQTNLLETIEKLL
ncbi:MAG TPA: hybrid sensor histidine kinase/response regulator, partial [bacterium]|nr:hybrid sensor histidine kinase/response regulator [bacterium]